MDTDVRKIRRHSENTCSDDQRVTPGEEERRQRHNKSEPIPACQSVGQMEEPNIHKYCVFSGWGVAWLVIDVVVVTTGLLSNFALLCLFIKDRKSMSASSVLVLNLLVMNLIYLGTLFFNTTWDFQLQLLMNHSASGEIDSFYGKKLLDTFSMFNAIGCPLLLTSMCVERYLAVAWPVLYLRSKSWVNRLVVSLLVWGTTLAFCLGTFFSRDMDVLSMGVSVIISCLFIIMLLCLVGVIHSLRRPGPTQVAGHREASLKKQAVCNVVAVVVPAVVTYFPILVILPLEVTHHHSLLLMTNMCSLWETANMFPMFGVFIGPLFYFARAKQVCCRSRKVKM